jgi:hypothetical protein
MIVYTFYCLKYFGLVVGQPFLDAAQEVNKAAATVNERNKRAIFFMCCV